MEKTQMIGITSNVVEAHLINSMVPYLPLAHPEEGSKNSDNCDFSKVSDIGKALYSMEN